MFKQTTDKVTDNFVVQVDVWYHFDHNSAASSLAHNLCSLNVMTEVRLLSYTCDLADEEYRSLILLP